MRRVANLLRELRDDNRGLAFIEFAFAGPIFVLLVIGGLEIANLAMAHLRVSQIAMTVADNAGRVTSGIDEANVRGRQNNAISNTQNLTVAACD
ncbi:MAG: TadE/TadG family type IV pilus assembly protein [Altererythrobacter sp.]